MQRIYPELFHLAQVNIATLRAPLHDPQMADFVAQIRDVNRVADVDPGFVWRLRSEGEDDATNIRAFEDDRILITLTVWRSLQALSDYVYQGAHAGVMRDRRRWFVKTNQPILALWWLPVGEFPTVEQSKERLKHLCLHGSTAYAFSFGKPFPSPAAISPSYPGVAVTHSSAIVTPEVTAV
ncbi:DUF3291 domain-containing protein [Phormidesmis sp. 146-12]